MKKRKLIWKLFPAYLAITLFSLAVIAIIATRSVRDFYYASISAQLESFAHLVDQQVANRFSEFTIDELDSISIRLGELTSSRITFIHPDGMVLGDTDRDPLEMENHADRPEIAAACTGKKGVSIRFSPTLKSNRMYLALPIVHEDDLVGVVRVSRSVEAIDNALKQVYTWIFLGGILIAVLASISSYLVSRRISKPLVDMKEGANRFAAGDLDHKLVVPPTEEIGQLADALNEMASQLRERISTVTSQRNELEAVLSSMVEGVLAVDINERILRMNHAAGRLLNIDPVKMKGRSLPEAIINPDFLAFAASVPGSSENREGEIVIGDGERYLQAHGTHLLDAEGEEIGILIVLNDVTRLRRLEKVRRDFVANVSHELKTPITSIQGFVETLRDGALNDPKDAEHFLEIISRHTDRLNAIIEDLLALSRIEREVEKNDIPLERGSIRKVLQMARQNCEPKASAKNIAISLKDTKDTQSMINAPLLEHAVTNLLDNAINYSPEAGEISLDVLTEGGEIIIEVKDHGCGIGTEHLPRLFERFYRADNDRSRKLGGTGLGLAIAKHITIAHHGRVSVDSIEGKGSVFRIHLPVHI